jgi:hypothetical protein
MNQQDELRRISDGVRIPTDVLRVINKCWHDKEFKRRLLADPVKVLEAEGISLSNGVAVRVFEDTENVMHLVLPPDATGQSASTDDSVKASAGGKKKKRSTLMYD